MAAAIYRLTSDHSGSANLYQLHAAHTHTQNRSLYC